jgi:hypothetical protein
MKVRVASKSVEELQRNDTRTYLNMRHYLSNIPRAIGVLLAPLAFLEAIFVWRHVNLLPLCTRIFDLFNVYPIPHHYYSPFIGFEKVSCGRTRYKRPRSQEAAQFELLAHFNFEEELLRIPCSATNELTFGYENNLFGAGDAEYLYNIVRYFKPKQIFEIGCGQSTLMAQLAIDDCGMNSICWKHFVLQQIIQGHRSAKLALAQTPGSFGASLSDVAPDSYPVAPRVWQVAGRIPRLRPGQTRISGLFWASAGCRGF